MPDADPMQDGAASASEDGSHTDGSHDDSRASDLNPQDRNI